MSQEPIELGWNATTLVDVPSEMVFSIAMGLENPDDIAGRHGFEGDRWEKLKSWKPFQQAVAAQRAEFEKTGVTFRVKQALKAEILADRVFTDAMGPDATLMQRVEVLKTLAKLADLEPKDQKGSPQGTTFAISIDLGEQSVRIASIQPVEAIDVEPVRMVADAFHITESP